MLQNTTQTTSVPTPIINWTSGLIGLGGVFLGFVLFVLWEYRQENKRKKEIFNRISDILIVELTQNTEKLKANIETLNRSTVPIFYLQNDSWKLALSSGVLQLFSDEIWSKLAASYFWVAILNQIIVQRESLIMSSLRSMGKLYTDTINLYSNYLLQKSTPLLTIVNEVLEKLMATTYALEKKNYKEKRMKKRILAKKEKKCKWPIKRKERIEK